MSIGNAMAITKILMRVPQDQERRAALSMTGRYILTVHKDAHQEASAKLSTSGFAAATPIPSGASMARALPRGSHLMLPHIGIAVVDPLPDQEDALNRWAAQEDAVIALEPERIVRAVRLESMSDYVRGWRDAIEALSSKLVVPSPLAPAERVAEVLATWGLVSTRVVNSRFSGTGIKVSILDTGFDITHPDFVGRKIETKNLVGDNAPFHDGVGHGTHCIGTVAGPLHPQKGPRYGIAYQCLIFAGRVLDDTGRGGDFNILQGINWAIEEGCSIVSLSLGAPWVVGDPPFSQAYESAAQRALDAGCLLIVAAGNEADNSSFVGAVGTPPLSIIP
jgi:subtilisin family serine protease